MSGSSAKSKQKTQINDDLDEKELNMLAKECMRIGYHREEVYDPTG